MRLWAVACGLAIAVVAVVAYDAPAAAPGRPLVTGVYLGSEITGADATTAMRRMRAAGARVVRIAVPWHTVVADRVPPDFRGADPDDPRYNWGAIDDAVERAAGAGLEPLLSIWGAPKWAQVEAPPIRFAVAAPALPDYLAFATAITKRYSGDGLLPRVRYWIPWNEPNAIYYWAPQFRAAAPASPDAYRSVLNGFAGIAHRVRRDNVVIAGALSPFTRTTPETMAPLRFMRAVLCVSRTGAATCSAKSRFDVWSHHPYTSGGPTHKAYGRDDVSLGDLPKMKAVLDAAIARGHVVAQQPVRFWVTEFSWDTKPPDPRGVPALLHRRWVAEALYRMWRAGVTLVTWLQIRDAPYPETDIQSGLYYRGPTIAADRSKPSLAAFRFPFVAFANRGRITYWGRTPMSSAAGVVVERTTGRGWRRITTVSADRFGIFEGTFGSSTSTGAVRARAGGSVSVPFSLVVPPNLAVTPFGVGPRN